MRAQRVGTNVKRDPAFPPSEASRGLQARVVEVHPRDVVYLKSLVEASEGLASIFGVKGGVLTIAAPEERAVALDELLCDLEGELLFVSPREPDAES